MSVKSIAAKIFAQKYIRKLKLGLQSLRASPAGCFLKPYKGCKRLNLSGS
jgi:hypothetical protein